MNGTDKSNHTFLLCELIKRDFKKKYKSTYLGMLWSLASPLLTLLVMSLLFSHFFGNTTPHYTIYLFCGNICFTYFNDMSTSGMGALLSNADIFSKIKLPKVLFVISRSVTSVINFALTLAVFLIFCLFDGIAVGVHFLSLLYPIIMLTLFGVGVTLILSVLFVFFRDMQYLWSVISLLLMYMSVIFYTLDSFPEHLRELFLINPIYVYITYFREVVIGGSVPSLTLHLLGLLYAVLFLVLGVSLYKRYDYKFIYYV